MEVCQLSCYTLYYIHIQRRIYRKQWIRISTHSPILYFFNFIVTENINFLSSLNTGVRLD